MHLVPVRPTQDDIRKIRDRIKAEGPLSTHAFESLPRSGEMWARPPHKKALEQMWYAGNLATSHREFREILRSWRTGISGPG